METIEEVRDYLHKVIKDLKAAKGNISLKVDFRTLEKEAARLSNIIVKRDIFDNNVQVLDPTYIHSKIAIKKTISTIYRDISGENQTELVFLCANMADELIILDKYIIQRDKGENTPDEQVMLDKITTEMINNFEINASKCDCFNCWSFRNESKYDEYAFIDNFIESGNVNDLIIQHYEMNDIVKDENSSMEMKKLANTQRELALIVAKQRFLKEYNKFKQQKLQDYEASK